MPFFSVRIKIGSTFRNYSNYEFKSLDSCKAFFEAASVAKIDKIVGVNGGIYEYKGSAYPIDDFNYRKQARFLIKDLDGVSAILFLNFLKKDLTTKEVAALIRTHCELNGRPVNFVYPVSF